MLATACDNGDDRGLLTPGLTAEPTATPTPTPTPASLFPPIEATPNVETLAGAIMVDIRTAQQQGFDQVVFEFQGGRPGYRIEYIYPPILEDPSGLKVEIAGAAFLRVAFHLAAAHDPETGEPTYTGPPELEPDLTVLRDAQLTGDSEGVLTWVLGLRQEVEFRATIIRDPDRVVIDILHP